MTRKLKIKMLLSNKPNAATTHDSFFTPARLLFAVQINLSQKAANDAKEAEDAAEEKDKDKVRKAVEATLMAPETEREQKRTEELEKKITTIKSAERKKVAKTALEKINQEKIQDLGELRDGVRRELVELGLNFEDPDRSMRQDLRELQEMIVKSVIRMLDTNDRVHQGILLDYQNETEERMRLMLRLKRLVRDKEKMEFVALATSADLPMDVKTAAAFKKHGELILQIPNNPELLNDAIAFVDIFGEDNHKLYRAFNDLDRLYYEWLNVESELEPHVLEREFDELAQRANLVEQKLLELKMPPEKIQQHFGRLKDVQAVLARNQNILRRTPSPANLRFLQMLLPGLKNQVEVHEKGLAAAKEAPQSPDMQWKEPEDDELAEILDEEAEHADSKSGAKQSADGDTEQPPVLEVSKPEQEQVLGRAGFLAMMRKIATANDHITWYSFHDISEAWSAISDSWGKYVNSKTQDKAGTLAENAFFFHKSIQARIHEENLAGDQSRAADRKKVIQYFPYEELLGELASNPPVDMKRAVLEVLAERGNLRMSDRRLVELVMPGEISDADWVAADQNNAYAGIRRKFKDFLDNSYIGEKGFGSHIFDIQANGQSKKIKEGKDMYSAMTAGGGGAEFDSIAEQIEEGTMDGDAIVAGMIQEAKDTGNLNQGNPGFSETSLAGMNKDDKFEANATMGFVMLKVIDGYLRGQLDLEMMHQQISVANEGGYIPFAALEDVLSGGKGADPKNPTRAVSMLEVWGWVKNGAITDLGKTQIINFFNARVAFDADGNPRHVAVDSGNYQRHSNTVTSAQKMGANDKIASGLVKAASLDVYNSCTSISSHEGVLMAQPKQVKALFRAATEEIIDARVMMQTPRYLNEPKPEAFASKDAYLESHKKWQDFKRRVDNAFSRGKQALILMSTNLVANMKDPSEIVEPGPAFRYIVDVHTEFATAKDREKYGYHKDKSVKKVKLKEYLHHQLVEMAGLNKVDPQGYREIMQAVNLLQAKADDPYNPKWEDPKYKKQNRRGGGLGELQNLAEAA